MGQGLWQVPEAQGGQGPSFALQELTDPQTDKLIRVKDGILAGRE